MHAHCSAQDTAEKCMETSIKIKYDQLNKGVGMAVPKSTQTRVGMIEINQVQAHPYYFTTSSLPNKLL